MKSKDKEEKRKLKKKTNDNKVNDTKKFENKIKGETKEDKEGSDGKQNDKNI